MRLVSSLWSPLGFADLCWLPANPQMFLGAANYSTEALKCSLDHQNIPHSLSNILWVRIIAQGQGHHTNLDHLWGILVTPHGIFGGGCPWRFEV